MLLLSTGVFAQSGFVVRQANFAEINLNAPVVFHGRVIEARQEPHPDYPNVATVRVTLEVLDNVRGAAGRRHVFRQFLPSMRMHLRGRPKASLKTAAHGYRPGQELVLFLHAPSQYGLSSPVGDVLGRFQVLRDRNGQAGAMNAISNRGLFDGVTTEAQKAGLALSAADQRALRRASGPVDLATLLSLARRLPGPEGSQ